jgi:hypothetical protein
LPRLTTTSCFDRRRLKSQLNIFCCLVMYQVHVGQSMW